MDVKGALTETRVSVGKRGSGSAALIWGDGLSRQTTFATFGDLEKSSQGPLPNTRQESHCGHASDSLACSGRLLWVDLAGLRAPPASNVRST